MEITHTTYCFTQIHKQGIDLFYENIENRQFNRNEAAWSTLLLQDCQMVAKWFRDYAQSDS